MSLRARKASETVETSHNLRTPKPVRQKSVEQSETEQYKIIEDSSAKNLRQSRRRKTTSAENEVGVDVEKKAHIENCVLETDQKTLKVEEIHSDTSESLTLFDLNFLIF
jgi:urease accessory protein UreE